MKYSAICIGMLSIAIALEIILALTITIIAHRTNTTGLGWIVVIGWIAIMASTGYLFRNRIPILMNVILLLISCLLSLSIFENVCLRFLRNSFVLLGPPI